MESSYTNPFGSHEFKMLATSVLAHFVAETSEKIVGKDSADAWRIVEPFRDEALEKVLRAWLCAARTRDPRSPRVASNDRADRALGDFLLLHGVSVERDDPRTGRVPRLTSDFFLPSWFLKAIEAGFGKICRAHAAPTAAGWLKIMEKRAARYIAHQATNKGRKVAFWMRFRLAGDGFPEAFRDDFPRIDEIPFWYGSDAKEDLAPDGLVGALQARLEQSGYRVSVDVYDEPFDIAGRPSGGCCGVGCSAFLKSYLPDRRPKLRIWRLKISEGHNYVWSD